MAKYEARVKTQFGEIVVSFDSTDDLKKNIDSLDADAVSDIVSKKFEAIIRKEPRQAKPGLEGVYRFTPEGKVELFRRPQSAPMTIGLLLYAYDPEPVTSDVIFSSTGIVAGNFVSQTGYKKYFDRTKDDRLLLTHPGRIWVETEVVPKLTPKAGKEKKEHASK